MTTPNQPTGSTPTQPTALKSVTLEQLLRLEEKSVVGARHRPGMLASTQSKIDRAAKKMDKIDRKIAKDSEDGTVGNDPGKHGSDDRGMRKDVDDRIGDGLPPSGAG